MLLTPQSLQANYTQGLNGGKLLPVWKRKKNSTPSSQAKDFLLLKKKKKNERKKHHTLIVNGDKNIHKHAL